MGVVTATILKNGTVIKSEFELLSIDILREYNRVPMAELVYIDGKPETSKFPLSDSGFFDSGNEIEIKLRYEGEKDKPEKTVFKGIVLGNSIRMNGNNCVLQVELSDTAIKMTGSRKSMVFEDVSDSDIIGKLITASGLKKGKVDSTKVKHKRMIQYHATDWDFLLCRAEANGLLVSAIDGELAAIQPDLSASAKHTFKFGLNEIYSFNIESDTRHQHTSVTGSSWDVKTQKLSAPLKAKAFNLNQAGLNATTVNKTMGNSDENLLSGVMLNDGEAQAWADATMIKNRLSVLRGNLQIKGDGTLQIGDIISLEGVSKLFTGTTIITGIRHQVNIDGWFTDIQFGLSAERFSTLPNVSETRAAGLLPGVNGLQIGVVEKFEADPEKEFRVKVRIPSINNDANIAWARLGATDAGKARGSFFFPEVGDEVILGFFNDDPRQPVILGSLYSSVNTPSIQPADKNPLKGITTREGLKITFDDEKKIMTLLTPGKQSITIDDDKKTIELADANENKVLMSKDGIKLDSAKDVIINAPKGEVKITAKAKVEISAKLVDVI